MLAPVILTRHDAQALPSPEDQTEKELERLRELLRLLDEISPKLQRPAQTPLRPTPQSQPGELSQAVSDQLKALERQNSEQLRRVEDLLGRSYTVLEGTVDQVKTMSNQLKEIERRLKEAENKLPK